MVGGRPAFCASSSLPGDGGACWCLGKHGVELSSVENQACGTVVAAESSQWGSVHGPCPSWWRWLGSEGWVGYTGRAKNWKSHHGLWATTPESDCLERFETALLSNGFLGCSVVENLPTMQEIGVRSLGQEDALEEDMAPTLVFLPGEFHGQRGLVGYCPWGHKESDMTELLHSHTHMHTHTTNTHKLSGFSHVQLFATPWTVACQYHLGLVSGLGISPGEGKGYPL